MQKVLIIPDTHAPYHDKKAWGLLLRAAKVLKPDTIAVLGDFFDFYSVSFHGKHPQRRFTLQEEIEAGAILLDDLESIGAKRKIFIAGNHEYRLERYLQEKAPDLWGVVDIASLLELKERGWEYVPYKEYAQIGKLYLTHDTGCSGAQAIKRALTDFGGNIVIGHIHRAGVVYQGCLKGSTHVAASFGWLGDVSAADYMHKVKAERDWVHGFGVAYLEKGGNCHLQAIVMVDGRCVIEGKLVT